jgi:hypothetical protein
MDFDVVVCATQFALLRKKSLEQFGMGVVDRVWIIIEIGCHMRAGETYTTPFVFDNLIDGSPALLVKQLCRLRGTIVGCSFAF